MARIGYLSIKGVTKEPKVKIPIAGKMATEASSFTESAFHNLIYVVKLK
jgi:hypothetical protein